MERTQTATLLVLTMMLTSGCLAAIDDIVEEIDDTIDIVIGDYPQIDLPERVRGENAVLEEYDDCDTLLDDLKDSLQNEMLVRLDQESYYHWIGGGWMWMDDDIAFAEDGATGTTAESDGGNSASREGEYSGTNNQEAGVDEADFLKTDGYHIYMLNGNLLVIMGVPEFGELTLESNLTLQGYPMQMMIDGDRIVIASTINAWSLDENDPLRSELMEEVQWGEGDNVYTYYRVQNLVKYTVVDITDRADPQVERELYIEGNYHTARMVDGTVRSVTHNYANFDGLRYWVDLPSDYWSIEDEDERMAAWSFHLNETINNNLLVIDSLTMDDFAPHIYEMTSAGFISHSSTSNDCSEFAASTDSVARGFTSIMTIEMLSEDIQVEVDHIASSWAHVYASQDVLILAEPANDWWWFWRNTEFEDATNIHAFDISQAGSTTYVASGRVAGTVQDQFSLSESNGVIRVATTEDMWGRWWMDTDNWTGPTNNVFTLEAFECMIPEGCEDDFAELQQIGHIGDIAEGERIWSARFMGDRAYLVTFENMDPLWVIDLSDPTNPTILGELEIPGVSTYIHPVDENTLLTIGIGGGEDGLGLDWSVTQISLFDVSDPTNPTLADTLPISPAYTDENCENVRSCGWSWSWSEATYEHKAFTYWAPDNLLAVPLSTQRYIYDEIIENGVTYTHYGYEYVSMLKLIEVDTENLTLSLHGDVNHSSFYNNENGLSNWWYGSTTSIRRSIFMGDYVYAFSALGATVHLTDDLTPIVELEIPGQAITEKYYDDEVEVADSEESESPSGDGTDPEES